MSKDEFIKRMQDLEHTKQCALEYNKRERAKAKEKYICDKCRFVVGEDVMLLGKKVRITFIDVDEHTGSFFGRVIPLRKDGTLCKNDRDFRPIDYRAMEKIDD